MTNIFDQDLDPNPANFTALSPVSFVERSAEIFGDLNLKDKLVKIASEETKEGDIINE